MNCLQFKIWIESAAEANIIDVLVNNASYGVVGAFDSKHNDVDGANVTNLI
jgi:short-subunit dehydrogenase